MPPKKKKQPASNPQASSSVASAETPLTLDEVARRYSPGAREVALGDEALVALAEQLGPALPVEKEGKGKRREQWDAIYLFPPLKALLKAATLGERLDENDESRRLLTLKLPPDGVPEGAKQFTAIDLGEDDSGQLVAEVCLLAVCDDEDRILRVCADTPDNRLQIEEDADRLIAEARAERDEWLPLTAEEYAPVLNEKINDLFKDEKEIEDFLNDEEKIKAILKVHTRQKGLRKNPRHPELRACAVAIDALRLFQTTAPKLDRNERGRNSFRSKGRQEFQTC